jgi:hypothetical protein
MTAKRQTSAPPRVDQHPPRLSRHPFELLQRDLAERWFDRRIPLVASRIGVDGIDARGWRERCIFV